MSWFNDLFTEAGTANLSAHTSNSGATWSLWAGDATSPKIFTSFGGVAASGAAATTVWAASAVAPQADVVISWDAYYDSSNFVNVGACARLQAAGGAGYLAIYSQANTRWEIHRLAGTSTTPLATSSTVTYAATNTPAVEFTVTGTGATVTLVLKVNGTQVISTTDVSGSRVVAAGKTGLWFSTNPGISTGMFLNTLTGDVPVVAAANVTMTGPTSGTTGAPSTNFTVGADGVITGTVIVTPSDGGGGGTFTPTTVSISSGSPTGTFTYTPATSGAKTISCTNNGSLGNPSNITYTASGGAATAVTMSGPSGGLTGVASTNFTVGANGAITGTVTVTPADGGAGGTFTPTSVGINTGSPTATFTYTPSSAGAKTISATNNGSLTNPSNITYTATAAATAVTLSGPSTGVNGVASTNFTAGVNGGLAGNVVVTPNDSSGGGAFTPTTVTLTPGAPSATFTYTPASTGAKTIGVTNGSALTNPSSLTYTVTGVLSAPYPLKLKDRVRDTASTASGTSITLNGAPPSGYRSFAAAHGVGATRIPVTVVDQGNAAWMTAYCTLSATLTLTVVTIIDSSAGLGVAPTFSGSTKDVLHGPLADAQPRKSYIDAGDYAIYPDFSSDSTPGFQQAILDAYNAGISRIRVPDGHYKIAGALTGTGNCQLYMPQTRFANPNKSVIIEGMGPSNFEQQGLINIDPPPTNGVVFESTVTGTGTNPAVFGFEQGNAGDPAGYIWNYTNLSILNCTIRVRRDVSNPMSGINAQFAAQLPRLDMLRIDGSVGLRTTVAPPSTSYGIILAPVNNHLFIGIGDVYISNFYTGVKFGEHTVINKLVCVGVVRGIELPGVFHASHINVYKCEFFKYGIYINGEHPLSIGCYDAEHNTDAAVSWAAFSADQQQVSGSRIITTLRATVVLAGTGYSDASWAVGGTDLHKTVSGAGAN